MSSQYKFAILRVVPDERRGERVNIGVVVFRPDGPDVRIFPSLAKVRALDATVDLDQLFLLPARLDQWLSKEESPESQHNALRHFGLVEVSELGTFEVRADDYESQVRHIMNTLVKPLPAPAGDVRHTQIQKEVRDVFKMQGILGQKLDDIDKKLVVPNFPIGETENLTVDFALRNGGFHLTETIDYRVRRMTDKQKETGLVAVKLHQASLKFGVETERTVLYYPPEGSSKALTPWINLLSEYADEVLNLASHDERQFYFRSIHEAATGQHSLPN